MKRNGVQKLIGALAFSLVATGADAQPVEKHLSVAELFQLTQQAHPTLKVSRADVDIAHQNVAVAKAAQLPALSLGVQGYYLGDAVILDKKLGDAVRVPMPHFGNSFSVQASQLIWKGGTLQNNIRIQNLKEELSRLNYETSEQSVKLLVLGYYMDLYKLQNQARVYTKNIQLAEQRLENINRLHKEGMVTRNDVIRGELQLSNLRLAEETVENNRRILNRQITTALGLPESTRIVPDSTLFDQSLQVSSKETYAAAAQRHPAVLATQKAIQTYEVAGKIVAAERLPYLSAFGGNQLQRPIVNTTPALDGYSNGWSAGLALGFNIDALYKTPQKLRVNRSEQARARAQAEETREWIDVAVNAAYIKYNEAVTQANTYEVNKSLAAENYRIMESKYNNQLAILLDLLDASNAKLDAELQATNAEANIIFSYYKLLKESGQL